MAATDLDEVITQDHLALEAFMRGDPEPKKRLYSHRDDATLSNPFGPPALGWAAIERTLDAASGRLREGQSVQFERVSAFATVDLAYTVEIERYSGVKLGGADDHVDHALRVTTIFQHEHRRLEDRSSTRGSEHNSARTATPGRALMATRRRSSPERRLIIVMAMVAVALAAPAGVVGARERSQAATPKRGGTLKLLGASDVFNLDTVSGYYTVNNLIGRASRDSC